MLILNEENKRLKGTKYRLPKVIVNIFREIVLKYPQYSNEGGYKKAKNVIENNGIVTMEWLKNTKAFFKKHVDSNDINYILCGGIKVKSYVETKLKELTATFGETTRQQSPTKPRQNASKLSGFRSSHASKSYDMTNELINNIIPKI